MRHWIFQGNPDKFDVEHYVAQNDDLLWLVRQKHLATDMQKNDEVFIWKSAGKKRGVSGVVARGILTDSPSEMADNPESSSLWKNGEDREVELRVPMRIVERFSGIVPVAKIKERPQLASMSIFGFHSQTNFRIEAEQAKSLRALANCQPWRSALFINGVFENVLLEIALAQDKNPELECYLQPHSSRKLRGVSEGPIDPPMRVYFSTSNDLRRIQYVANLVRLEDKREIDPGRLDLLNEHIRNHQPNEQEIYLTSPSSGNTASVNLLTIRDLRKMPIAYPVKSLVKISDGSPYKPRTQSGGWSYVYEMPTYTDSEEVYTESELENELRVAVRDSLGDERRARLNRLSSSSPIPDQIQVATYAYKRNADVIAEVLHRADGKCECCLSDAPFLRQRDNSPFLEVHHIIPLAEQGEDTVDNAVALCPNCHREAHYGDTFEIRRRLTSRNSND